MCREKLEACLKNFSVELVERTNVSARSDSRLTDSAIVIRQKWGRNGGRGWEEGQDGNRWGGGGKLQESLVCSIHTDSFLSQESNHLSYTTYSKKTL